MRMAVPLATEPLVTPRQRWATFLAIAVLSLVAAHLLDGWAYRHIVYAKVYDKDWGRMLRTMGFLPLWLTGALALFLCDRPLRLTQSAYAAGHRALLLFLAPTATGISGELLKLLVRRERPGAHAGHYFFRSFADRPFYSGGLAFPSSHAVVAFGAAAILSRLFPRARWVWYALAIGCGLTRIAAHAHFLSDVTGAALLAWLVVALLWRWHLKRMARAQAVAPNSGVAG